MQHLEAEAGALKEKLNEKTSEVSSTKSDSDSHLRRLKLEVARLEKEVKDLREDNNQLIERVAEEIQSKTSLERKFSMENHDLEARFNQLNAQLTHLKSPNQALPGSSSLAELEGLESELRRVKRNHDQELRSLRTQLKIVEKENSLLKEQVIKATTSEFSDPATIIYQDQISNLTDKLANIDKGHSKERQNLHKKISELEQENEGLEKRKIEISSFYDSKLTSLTAENEKFRQNNPLSTDQLAASLVEQDSKHSAKIAQLEIQDLQKRVRQLQEDYVSMEKKFVNSKMGWAQAEIEKENLLTKYREAQEQLRIYSADYTTMEVELYKLNERFGQTINTHNELEMENQVLRLNLEQCKNGGKKKKW